MRRKPHNSSSNSSLLFLCLLLCLAHPRQAVATQSSESWSPLRAYVHTPGLVEDYGRACYASSSSYVKFGSPAGCGAGCQHVDTVTQVSSQYIYEGQQTSAYLVGKPSDDDSPSPASTPPTLGQTLKYSWTSSQPNSGTEFFQFEVKTATYVTKMEVFQGHNPGAVSKVEAFDLDQVQWTEVWSSSDADASKVSADGRVLTVFAQLKTKRVPAKEYRVTLDTSKVVGYNTIDAVRVYGLGGSDGKPLAEYTPLCDQLTQTDCYYQCKAEDYVEEAKGVANLNALRASVNWVEAALKVKHVERPASELKTEALPSPTEAAAQDGGSQMCHSLPLAKALQGMERHHADVAIIVTHRPSFAGAIEARACSRFNDTAALKRPAVVHLNLVPGFASGVGITKDSKLQRVLGDNRILGAVDAHLAAVDAVTHYLYRALGWDTYFRSDFMGYNGQNVTTERQQSGTTWAGRYRILLNLPKIVGRAESHFGASGLEGVELENSEASPTVRCRGLCLESRVYNGEVMTPPPYARDMTLDDATHKWSFGGDTGFLRPMARSAISLAYLQETGWYEPNFLIADHLAWGKGAGNDFVKHACKTWGTQAGEASRYLCKLSQEPALYTKDNLESMPYPTQQQKQCTYDRIYKGMCVTKLWGADLPEHSEYWLAESGTGGISSQVDYCPMVVPEPSNSYNNAGFHVDCRDSVGGPADPTTRFFEEFSESSRCFETNTLGDSTVFTSCLVHKCTKDGKLHIKVKDETKACPSDGGKVTFQQSGIMVDCSGYSHLCAMYKEETKPTISVISPLDSVVVATRDLEASVLIDNYAVNQHFLKVFVSDVLYETVKDFTVVGFAGYSPTHRKQGAPDESMLTLVDLGSLPVRAKSSTNSIKLRYQLTELVDRSEVALSSVETNHFVNNGLDQWAKPVSASSEHPQFPLDQGLAVAEDSKGWLPKQILDDGTDHHVVVELANEVQLSSLAVYYNFGYANQQLKSVSVANVDDPSSGFTVVWKRSETEAASQSNSQVGTVSFASAPFFTKQVKVEFDGSQWVEVDAIKCSGYLKIVPTFQANYSTYEISLPAPVSAQNYTHPHLFSFAVPFNSSHTRDAATIFWKVVHSVEDDASFNDWVSIADGHGEGIARLTGEAGNADAVVPHSVTLVIDVTKAPKIDTAIQLNVLDKFETDPAAEPLLALSVKLSNQVDANDGVACYDGAPVATHLAKRCLCAPGAYGKFCELHDCPADCSGNGICDASTGRCTCANGFYGVDCSGKHPKCYVSKDGTCEKDFELGTYVIDSGSPDSVNYAEGNAPHSLLCDGSVHPANEFECSALSKVEFCCQNKVLPACPFAAGSPPCAIPGCPYISAPDFALANITRMEDVDATFGVNTTARALCTAAVKQHCYSNPEDLACAGIRQTAVPATECPISVPVDHCKLSANHDSEECTSLLPGVASFPRCNFMETGEVLNPCSVPSCKADPFSLGECRGFAEQHCAKYPQDRECELHGLGDGCFFLPGSSPCRSVDCQQSGFLSDACMEVVKGYCTYDSKVDPECLVYGYTNSLLKDKVESLACPWENIRTSCAASDLPDKVCILLQKSKLAVPSPASTIVFDESLAASVLQLHAKATKRHRNSLASAGLVSMLMNNLASLQALDAGKTSFNDKELTALLSLFPLEAVMGQYFVHYSWSDQLSQTLYPLLSGSGFATEAEIQGAVEKHLFGGSADATKSYLLSTDADPDFLPLE
ncbi:hypothetical protein A3770_01p07980 [Chloropicon primus]|uniref:EGF-like domain-containing protein n=3 Tax=Chloropicon primus TaxID=1764295 RepID=A0A5B8MG14_9CHLO|nr:hypothetical protein A3770_01p07980 [Chloropicon primus]|eukprot:QDZ18280.1 hypothetical protein A3770_01p07980 [Chloropicon primus]